MAKATSDKSLIEFVPPHHDDAEEAVLACVLVDGSTLDACRELGLEPRHFYRQSRAAIYAAAMAIAAKGLPVDLVTMRGHLDADGQLAEAGGYGYLVDLAGSIPTTAHLAHYASLVLEAAQLRDMATHHRLAIADIHEPGASPQAVADAFAARSAVVKLARGNESEADTMALVDEFYADLGMRMERRRTGQRHLLELGMYDLDHLIGGFEPGEFAIVGARPSMGKTAFALNAFWNVGAWGRVRFYSLEMSKAQLMQRLVGMIAGVDSKRLRAGDLNDGEHEAIGEAMRLFADRDLVIDDGAHLTLERLRRGVLRDVAEGRGPKAVFIDYLQLMATAARSDNRTQALGELSRGIKQLAREANTVIIALSQLSRGVESRPDKRPMLSDLRESGNFEQDADQILMLYRDEYYNRETEKKGIVEVILGKHRNGSVGAVEMYFNRTKQRFEGVGYNAPAAIVPPASAPIYEAGIVGEPAPNAAAWDYYPEGGVL